MDKVKVKFYNDSIDIYKRKGLSTYDFDQLFQLMLSDFKRVNKEDYDIFNQSHIDLLNRALEFYVEIEEFKHAAVISGVIKDFTKMVKSRQVLGDEIKRYGTE